MATVTSNVPGEIYQFRVLLLGIGPAIWRRILIRSTTSVADLHYVHKTRDGMG